MAPSCLRVKTGFGDQSDPRSRPRFVLIRREGVAPPGGFLPSDLQSAHALYVPNDGYVFLRQARLPPFTQKPRSPVTVDFVFSSSFVLVFYVLTMIRQRLRR